MKKYGNPENLTSDIATLNLIISSQGNSLLIDCIAENAGNAASKFDLSKEERIKLLNSILDELRESLSERL